LQLRQILAVAGSGDDIRYCGNYQVEMFNCWIPVMSCTPS